MTVDKLSEQAAARIPSGGAGLIVIYSRSAVPKLEHAVTAAVRKVIGEAHGNHVQPIKGPAGRSAGGDGGGQGRTNRGG